MTAVTYTAKRSLAAGHSADTSYTIDLRVVALDPAPDVAKEASVAMSGRTETVMWRNFTIWQVTTAAFRSTELALAQEFLQSVVAGEEFEFDVFGTSEAEIAPQPAVLDGLYRLQRAVRQGDGGANDYWRFSFTVRQTTVVPPTSQQQQSTSTTRLGVSGGPARPYGSFDKSD